MQVVELTEACVNYLSEKFVDFDEDGDKLLSAAEQAAMFSTAPSRQDANPLHKLPLRLCAWCE